MATLGTEESQAVVERLKREWMYGLSTKKVAASGGLTISPDP